MLLTTEQRSEAVPLNLLLAFTRRLVLNTVGGDAVMLAMWAACKDVGMPRDQGEQLLAAALREQQTNGIWPQGF